MATYYVGTGGNNSNNGTTWALRKLTLNGAEDIPVAAGDTVYVGPGVYRESLTVDVSGSSGSPIAYIGDVTGENTDGVGGVVRITGSDNDTSGARNDCVTATSKNYRIFTGFMLDGMSSRAFILADCTNWIISDCQIEDGSSSAPIYISGASQAAITIRRCVIMCGYGTYSIQITHSSTVSDTAHVIENCMFFGRAFLSERVGGVTIRNCLMFAGLWGVRVGTALAASQTVTVNHCIFVGSGTALQGTTTGEIVENYNTLFGVGTARSNVDTGANSNTNFPLFMPPMLKAGHRFPWTFGALSNWSTLARIAGATAPTDDLFGMTRPATASKQSWGPFQYVGAVRDTTTKDGATGASIKLPDAGEQFIMRALVSNASTTISLKVYRESDYAGDLPQMILRQPGQADETTTDTGDAAEWNTLSDTLTPAALPPYIDIFVRSRNTATSGNYAVYVDTVSVS